MTSSPLASSASLGADGAMPSRVFPVVVDCEELPVVVVLSDMTAFVNCGNSLRAEGLLTKNSSARERVKFPAVAAVSLDDVAAVVATLSSADCCPLLVVPLFRRRASRYDTPCVAEVRRAAATSLYLGHSRDVALCPPPQFAHVRRSSSLWLGQNFA